uniref:EGF like domain multiple 6 n=1 Tax=Molossus molossus TaxID=27622 RepID=A0A7J8HZT2_MOLMO|nr:hypothetical protein HJG59_010802 [Molossus molossus]
MTSRLWLWCFCAWVAAGWPRGRAVQLRPDMPNVCEEQQLTAVGQPQPSVRAFTHLVSRWEQGCAPPGWCVGYERRTRYYTMYRQAYSMEQRTVYRCCPGWRRQDAEPGCQHSISAAGTCFNGRRCSDSEAQPCQCSEGFQGPRCQYDINECAVDNGGCQDQCCNTIGSYYCRCQAGRKLGEDGRGCEDIDECAVVNGGCQQRCINTPGTFHCECDTGYRLHADARTCIKMDPCTGGNGCAHICQSENGMARCACHPGYQLSEDNKACRDINECAEGLARCGHRCVNSVGSFACACHPGSELGADGNGVTGLNWKLSIAVKRTMVVVLITVSMHSVGPVVPVTMDTGWMQMGKHA